MVGCFGSGSFGAGAGSFGAGEDAGGDAGGAAGVGAGAGDGAGGGAVAGGSFGEAGNSVAVPCPLTIAPNIRNPEIRIEKKGCYNPRSKMGVTI